MRLLEQINQRIGFTRNESIVVLFLVGTLLLGGIIKLFQETVTPTHPRFDYTTSDREFALLSQQVHDTSHALDSAEASGQNPETAPSTTQNRQSSTKSRPTKSKPSGPININTATKAELMQLPGIGEAMAERIVLYREDHGPFHSPDDLLSVKGIGKKKLENLKPYITIH